MEKSFNKVKKLLSALKITLSISDRKSDDTIYYPIEKNRSKIIYQYFNRESILFLENYDIYGLKLNACLFALHEIGHFIITPKQRRRRKDFGIPNNIIGNRKYDFEEIKATMVENELRKLFGFKYSKKLYSNANVSSQFIIDNKKKIMQWWNEEGKLLAKTYADLV